MELTLIVFSSIITANQPNTIYPASLYPQSSMMSTANVPFNMPQCAQQPPPQLYFNQSTSRLSGAYYSGP